MNLNNNARHVRWFFFVQNIMGQSSYHNGTNPLPFYARYDALGGPLLVLGWLTLVGLWICGAVVAPIALFGWGALLVWGVAGLAILVIIGLIRFCMDFKHKSGGIVDCVLTHAKATKGKFCPLITFRVE